ncbi:hypothetical protein G4X40_02360 [Rhodococcus sp. D2-41]|uniref:Uncharacterized protein n=1 Tax=Speluncibacter jeojiensis TaxID=2710754 RepID=A0A9X4RE69_9ACTN|nr:hypothetical protein [Rhodococcus sp. D2-41]MDG3008988.1 hypothetical protein [Rhodococcus sp. D2-41]MDG3015499.1 hypothetical protein [Corynebacteriales bacterium D3-21]
MSAPQWWDPRTLLDDPDVASPVRSQLATAAVLGADPGERDDWREAAERAGVPIGSTGLGGVDPAQEYHEALAAARSAAESAQARAALAHASGMTVDAMLDAGAVGLRFFEQFLPLAAALAPIGVGYPDVRRRFDEQRGLDVAALGSDAERVRAQARAAAEQLDVQRAQSARLLEEQWGVAVDAAGALLRDHLDRAACDLAHLRRCADALDAAAHTLWSVVRDKAEMTAGLGSGEIGGRTVAQITLMVESVCGVGAPDHAAAAAVTGWQPAVPGVSAAAPVAAVRAACERWLREVFVPSVQSRCRAFTALCDQADAAVSETFRVLTALLDETDIGPYPRPGSDEGTHGGDVAGPPTMRAPSPLETATVAGAGASGYPVREPGPPAAPAAEAPAAARAVAEPTQGALGQFGQSQQVLADWRAAAPNALPGSVSAGVAGVPGLSALVGDFGGQVVRVVTEVGEALHEVGDALHGAFPEPAPPAPPAVPVVMGDFTVALELSPAAMSLEVTGPDGQPHGYAVTIGPDGVPQLTEMEPGEPDRPSGGSHDPAPTTSDPVAGAETAGGTEAAGGTETTADTEVTGDTVTPPPDESAVITPDTAAPQTDPSASPTASSDAPPDGGAPHEGPLDMVDRPAADPADEPLPVGQPTPVNLEPEEPAAPTPVTAPSVPDDTGARLAESWE